jgi:hypothetical protein
MLTSYLANCGVGKSFVINSSLALALHFTIDYVVSCKLTTLVHRQHQLFAQVNQPYALGRIKLQYNMETQL